LYGTIDEESGVNKTIATLTVVLWPGSHREFKFSPPVGISWRRARWHYVSKPAGSDHYTNTPRLGHIVKTTAQSFS